MNSSKQFCRVKPLVLAIALALPGAAAFAESFDDVVKTRSDQNIEEQYGRDSVYAFSRYAKPANQTVSDLLDKTKALAAGAWDKTKVALDKTKTVLTQQPAIPPNEPERYGRAGGFIGVDQFMVPQPGVTALASAPANSDAVKTGESQWGYSADARNRRDLRKDDMPSARDSSQDQGSSTMSQDQAAGDTIHEQNAAAAPATLQQDSSAMSNAEPVTIQDHTPMETQEQRAAAVSNDVVHDSSAMSPGGRTDGERFDSPEGQMEPGDPSR
jgi:hypothetical protein